MDQNNKPVSSKKVCSINPNPRTIFRVNEQTYGSDTAALETAKKLCEYMNKQETTIDE